MYTLFFANNYKVPTNYYGMVNKAILFPCYKIHTNTWIIMAKLIWMYHLHLRMMGSTIIFNFFYFSKIIFSLIIIFFKSVFSVLFVSPIFYFFFNWDKVLSPSFLTSLIEWLWISQRMILYFFFFSPSLYLSLIAWNPPAAFAALHVFLTRTTHGAIIDYPILTNYKISIF